MNLLFYELCLGGGIGGQVRQACLGQVEWLEWLEW